MNWNKDKSVTLSQACVIVFALCLLALDVGCRRFAQWFAVTRAWDFKYADQLSAVIIGGSVFAWVCLWKLWALLWNIRHGKVFAEENVSHMRVISHCCLLAAVLCAVSCRYYLPFGFIAVAAGFMALIVRIVKNAFQQAIAMKDELDLTV
ncbi:MAG: DUF2975 domain-containing protein [Oscillospiraceae bacterium]|nr:DUF2975 domain-containing protein [Oscillospiraceae bacterium]